MVDASYDASIAVVGIIFTVLTVMVYLPQVYELFKYRHTVGISFFSLWIANMNGFAGAWNIWMLNADSLKQCRKDGLDCLNTILAVIQISLSWWMPLIIYVQYMVFFVDEKEVKDPTKPIKFKPSFSRWKLPAWRWIVFWTVVYVLFMLVLFIIYIPLAIDFGIDASTTMTYAQVIGYIAAAVNIVQWFPQIVTTIRKKHSGSLSVLGVLIMIPGNFAQAGWLIADDQDISTWVSLMVAGVQLIILFLLLVYFDVLRPRFNKALNETIEKLDKSIKLEEICHYNGCDDEFVISKFECNIEPECIDACIPDEVASKASSS
jgi:uncharacterized protein with PQ loop repeat